MYGAVLGEKKKHTKVIERPSSCNIAGKECNFRTRKIRSLMRYIYNLTTDEHRNKYLRFLRLLSSGISEVVSIIQGKVTFIQTLAV